MGNFNDGFGGGDEITENLLLNTCRESSDHGPWNSWDRVPYITDVRNGTPSIIPADRHIHHNFILGTYNSESTIDTDDGSSYMKMYKNFVAYADFGMKTCVSAHDGVWSDNIICFVGVCYQNFGWRGYNDGFWNNTCIIREYPRGHSAIPYGSDCNKSNIDASF